MKENPPVKKRQAPQPKPTGTAMVVLDPACILELLTHYTDGRVPLNCRLLEVGVGNFLDRHIGLLVESDQWGDETLFASDTQDKRNVGEYAPLHIRYEGKKVLSWGDKHAPVEWKETENFNRDA